VAGTEKKNGSSIKNEAEAAAALGALDSSPTFPESMKLYPASNPSVFVITLVRRQIAQISSTLNASSDKMVSLDTVHSIQGQERDVVIFSLVGNAIVDLRTNTASTVALSLGKTKLG